MTALERAIADIVATLESLHINYALIGGIANAVWGEPRATVDVDVTISVDDQQIPDTIEALARRFRIAVQDPLRFVRYARVAARCSKWRASRCYFCAAVHGT